MRRVCVHVDGGTSDSLRGKQSAWLRWYRNNAEVGSNGGARTRTAHPD